MPRKSPVTLRVQRKGVKYSCRCKIVSKRKSRKPTRTPKATALTQQVSLALQRAISAANPDAVVNTAFKRALQTAPLPDVKNAFTQTAVTIEPFVPQQTSAAITRAIRNASNNAAAVHRLVDGAFKRASASAQTANNAAAIVNGKQLNLALLTSADNQNLLNKSKTATPQPSHSHSAPQSQLLRHLRDFRSKSLPSSRLNFPGLPNFRGELALQASRMPSVAANANNFHNALSRMSPAVAANASRNANLADLLNQYDVTLSGLPKGFQTGKGTTDNKRMNKAWSNVQPLDPKLAMYTAADAMRVIASRQRSRRKSTRSARAR